MILLRSFVAVFFTLCWLKILLCSYLDYPRINFAGKFRVDSNGINNYRCNFRMDRNVNYSDPPNIHDFGSNSFMFYDAKVKGTVTTEGKMANISDDDTLDIVTNTDLPLAKLVDLDVDCQMHSTLYGMKFGIRSQKSGHLLMYGDWTPCVIANNLWPQLTCFDDRDKCLLKYSPSGESFSSQSSTTLTNIKWAPETELPSFLSNVKKLAKECGNVLTVRITLQSFKYTGRRAELGWVKGVIGVPNAEDALCIPGQRIMLPVKNSAPNGLTYDICDLCMYKGNLQMQGKTWLGATPFKVKIDDEGETAHVSVDFSSTVVMDNERKIRDIKKLELVVLGNTDIDGFKIIGEFEDYTEEKRYTEKGGIYDFDIHDKNIVDLLEKHPLAVVQSTCIGCTNDSNEACQSERAVTMSEYVNRDQTIEICQQKNKHLLLLKEHEYFVRPKGYYVGRFDAQKHSVENQMVYITKYGKPPQDDIVLTVYSMTNPELSEPLPTIPQNGVVGHFIDYDKSKGIATVRFRKNRNIQIPKLRIYGIPMCKDDARVTIPIDGQVYFFYYSIDGHDDDVFQSIQTVYLAHFDYEFTSPPTWVNDVGPIFIQYARLTPMMKTILDLSNYRDVTKPHNINLLRKNFALDFNDPSYMPTTRDLSPAKREMILTWLDNPIYDDQCKPPRIVRTSWSENKLSDSNIKVPSSEDVPIIPSTRCDKETAFAFADVVYTPDSSFSLAYDTNEDHHCHHIKKVTKSVDKHSILALLDGNIHGDLYTKDRPLLRNSLKLRMTNASEAIYDACSADAVKSQLQTALRLEWSTIPAYLTALYSISDGCNTEIYHLIRIVVMQEMFHFALVGNILIAIGEVPEIDSPSFVPSYPGHLPGCVLPGVEVSLEKLSLKHIHDVFMMIELPAHTEVVSNMVQKDLFTIGAFYDEIKTCLDSLPDDQLKFDKSTEKYQVKWRHWDAESIIGSLSAITDKASAIAAIDTIVSQGEGSGLLDPMDIEDKTYAHFFKFEEIYCQHHIKQVSEHKYSYSGHPIEFNPKGVAPMRRNPSTRDLPQDTLCYTESRVFHHAYRNFLRKLQEVFNGHKGGKPQDIFVAVELMEALQLNAKRLMWIDFDGNQTCGPVWDYEFKEKSKEEN